MKQILISILFMSFLVLAQSQQDELLKAIDEGKQDSVKNIVSAELKKKPRDADWQYLQAIIITDGDESVKILKEVVKQSGKGKYLDAAWFRLYQYYYALGLYNQANECKDSLQNKFSKSKYTGMTGNTSARISSKEKSSIPGQEEQNDYPFDLKEKKTDSKDLYLVQAGAFSKRENAEQTVKKLNNKNTGISEKNVGGTVFYIVSVGSFQTEADAQEYSIKINKKLALQSRVIKK